jgi:hypothetical protein
MVQVIFCFTFLFQAAVPDEKSVRSGSQKSLAINPLEQVEQLNLRDLR